MAPFVHLNNGLRTSSAGSMATGGGPGAEDINAATKLPWAPATGGLRNITGKVNPNGTVTIWGVTSTVSGGGDQGADPNQLLSVTDKLNATALPSSEKFLTVVAPRYDQVVRGVSFTPGTRR
jgi:hypothetical protein